MSKFGESFKEFGRSLPMNRFFMWMGHNKAPIFGIAMVVGLLSDSLLHGALKMAVNVVAVESATLALIYNLGHDMRLCVHCGKATPLNGHKAAARRWLFLRTAHFLADLPYRGGLLLWLGIGALSGMFNGTVHLTVEAVCTLLMIHMVVSERMHYALYPWCPWCHWRDGGEEEESPDPAPVQPETV